MEIDVTATLKSIVIGATGLEEILQNVRTILGTLKGSVPLDREFGVDGAMVDEPMPVVMARRTADIVAAVEKYEPRVKVVRVEWQSLADTADGKALPVVRIKIKEGVVL